MHPWEHLAFRYSKNVLLFFGVFKILQFDTHIFYDTP